MKIKYLAALLLASGLLAGCGGSGGSSTSAGPTPLATVTITPTNAPAVAGNAFAAATLKFNSLSPLGVQTTIAPSDERVLHRVTDFALKKIAEYPIAPASVTGVATSAACISGDATSGTYSFDTDGSSAATSTYAILTFSNCKFSTDSTLTINGTFSVTGLVATTTTQSATVSINITYTDTSTIKLVGGYTLSASGVTTATRIDTLTGSSLVFSFDASNEALSNFSFSSSYNDTTTTPVSYSDTVNYTISSDFSGGSFTLATITPIVQNSADLYPHSGQVVIYGANSTALRATILSTSGANIAGTSTGLVTLEFSTNNGTSWTSLPTKPWAQM